MTATGGIRVSTAAGEGLRALWVLVLVLGSAAAMLAGLDAIPTWLHGEPRGVRRVGSVEDAERRLRARVLLPAYFPDAYRWPPAVVRVSFEDGGAVSLSILARDGTPGLLLAQRIAGPGPIPAALLPEAATIHRQSGPLGEGSTLSRVVGEDGTLWSQLEWTGGGRRQVLRGKGSLEDLIRMARSVHGGAR
jgi:hypothetical protein